MNERRNRVAKALLLGLALVGTCAVIRSRKPPPLAAPTPIVAHEPATGSSTAAPRDTTRTPALAPAPPVIDSVTLEKDEVCEGEENLVTVRAHTLDGNDPFLHYRVGGESGSQVALRSYLDDEARPTAHRVSVFGKNNVATSVAVPHFRVKACDPGPAVVIEHRVLPNSSREFEWMARIVSRGAQRADAAAPPIFRPQAYTWSFGDGSREGGRAPVVRHAFAPSDDALYSQYLVEVEVLGEDGKVVKGRRSLELLNPAFEAFAYKGVVVLATDLDPRFPVLSGSGVVDQGIRLSHGRPGSVFITQVRITTRYLDTSRRDTPELAAPASILGHSEIPAGRGITFHVKLDTERESGVVARDYALEGRSHDGHPVRGAFSVMKPPPMPTKERHDRIVDPVLLAKVKFAREVLHREFVTDEDIGTLERTGQFQNLDAGSR